MVGVLQFFDFGQTSSSRKFLALNRHNSGLEPPRNSLEVPMNTYHNFPLVHEDIQYSSCYKEDICQQSHTKKLIAVERLHRAKDQHNRPSVVARLMGMESLPSDTKPSIHSKELNDHKRPRKKANFVSSSRQPSYMTRPIEHPKNLFPCDIKRDFDPQSGIYEIDKPLPREHPQEELLQKFKKEFEAWQASKVHEQSMSLQLKHDPLHRRYMNTLSQGSLNKEKVSRYHFPSARSVIDHDEQENFLEYEEFVSNLDDNGPTKHNASAAVFDHGQSMRVSPGRIVILKPSLEVNDGIEESCLCSPLMLKKQRNIHDFLEQVKERLIVEMQGKPRSEITTTWTEPEVFVDEELADSEQISSKTFNRIKGGAVSTGDKIAMMQPKSTSSYRNEVQFRGKTSPGFVSKNATKSSEKMEDVLKDETVRDSILIFRQKPFTSLSNKEAEKEPFSKMHHFLNKESANLSYSEKRKAVSKSFRRVQTHAFDDESESPKNLTRSYSAPVSGTEFRKLLLEDKNVLTVAHIHRTHEAPDNNIIEQRKTKKDVFNIKNRVSSLRQNLMLKSKLFGKRTQLMDQSTQDEMFFLKAIETTPSVLMSIAFEQDNSTEVPPSPASVCSSSYDEICRPYYPSPVSPLEVLFDEDFPSLPSPYEELDSNRQDTSYLFSESNLSEELEYDGSTEAKSATKQTKNGLQEFECTAKAYVRNILFTSGLFEKNHPDQALWEWGTPRKPISMLVFEEVEETYQITSNMESSTFLLNDGNTEVSHRILFDLLNEALLRAVQNSKPDSAFKKWDISKKRLPHGNELLETLWQQIQSNICPPEDELCSILSMVARDLSTSWSSMLHEDLDIICEDMESLIIENLTDELVDNLGGFSCVQCY